MTRDMTDAELESIREKLVRQYVISATEMLMAVDDLDPGIQSYHVQNLTSADVLTDHEIEEGRGLPMGDEVAETILKIRRIRAMTAPIKAKGWRRTARRFVYLILGLSGLSMGLQHNRLGEGILGMGVGVAVAIMIGNRWFGGLPTTAHAMRDYLNPSTQKMWALVGEKLAKG